MTSESDDLLAGLFKSAEAFKQQRLEKKRKKPTLSLKKAKPVNALKKYHPRDDLAIKHLPRKPERIITFWTLTLCRCGKKYSGPKFGQESTFVIYPNRTKKGVIDHVPLAQYIDLPPGLSVETITVEEKILFCSACCESWVKQLPLPFPPASVDEVPKPVTKPLLDNLLKETQEEDIRGHLDDYPTVSLEELGI